MALFLGWKWRFVKTANDTVNDTTNDTTVDPKTHHCWPEDTPLLPRRCTTGTPDGAWLGHPTVHDWRKSMNYWRKSMNYWRKSMKNDENGPGRYPEVCHGGTLGSVPWCHYPLPGYPTTMHHRASVPHPPRPAALACSPGSFWKQHHARKHVHSDKTPKTLKITENTEINGFS